MKSIQYVVFDKRESLLQSLIKDLGTFGFILLCIYTSQGSKAWTFITVCLFLLFILARGGMTSSNYNKFGSKNDLLKWVESLPED